MRMKAALEGSLEEYLEKEYQNCAKAVTYGVKTATNGLKQSLRLKLKTPVLAAGLPTLGVVMCTLKAKTALARRELFTPRPRKSLRVLSIPRSFVRQTGFGSPFQQRLSPSAFAINE